MLKKILQFIFAIILIILMVPFFFYLQSTYRETETADKVAPASGRFIQTHDAKIFIQEAGPITGKTVLLVPGTGAWSEIWRTTIAALITRGFHVVAIDLPPFGFSDKPDGVEQYSREKQAQRIIDVLDALHIKKVILVGHSVGTRPTMEVALKQPARVESLVLVDPALGFADQTDANMHFVQNNPSSLMRVLFYFHPLRNALLSTYATNPFFTSRIFKSFVYQQSAVTKERVQMLQQPLVVKGITNGYADWLQYLMMAQDNSLGSNFKNFKLLSMPVKLIWGDEDTVTPLWQGKALQKMLPHAELVVITGVGHIPYIENVEQFNAVLLSLIIA